MMAELKLWIERKAGNQHQSNTAEHFAQSLPKGEINDSTWHHQFRIMSGILSIMTEEIIGSP